MTGQDFKMVSPHNRPEISGARPCEVIAMLSMKMVVDKNGGIGDRVEIMANAYDR